MLSRRIAAAVMVVVVLAGCSGPAKKEFPLFKGQEHAVEFVRQTMELALHTTHGIVDQQRKVPKLIPVGKGKKDCGKLFTIGNDGGNNKAIGYCPDLQAVVFSPAQLADIAEEAGSATVQIMVLDVTRGLLTRTLAEPNNVYAHESPCVHGLMAYGFDQAGLTTAWTDPRDKDNKWMQIYERVRNKGNCHS